MNNYAGYLTPQQAKERGDSRTIDEIIKAAAKKPKVCMNCDEMAWKMAGCGLCFSCTTGEADASDDYELRMP